MRFSAEYRSTSASLMLLAFLAAASPVGAAEPAVRNVNVRGLQVGSTTTLVIDGDELGKAPRVLLPFPAQQRLKPGNTDKQATFEIGLDAAVTPGYHHLRVVTEEGVSFPVVIGVDALPQRPTAPSVDALPVALHGTVGGSATVEVTFAGKAGQKVMAEVEANRLGSKLRPVVHLMGPKRLQVAWAWPTPALSGDARLEAALPEDGTYTVSVHDAEYAAPAPGFFRLRLGQWAYVDQVFPPVVAKGPVLPLELIGPAGPTKTDAPPTSGLGAVPLAWPKGTIWSGPRPFASVSSHAELVEQPDAAKGQPLPAGPVGVSGRLLAPFEEDRYRVPVTPGTRVRFEVTAERLGSPLDAALVVRNEKGDTLTRAEDSPGTTDPVLEYAVPDKVTAVLVGVMDAQGRGGPRGVYHLAVEPSDSAKEFKMLTTAQRLNVAAGGRYVVPVHIIRRGYGGSVEVAAAGLPGGVRLEGTNVPDGADGTLVTLHRAEAAGDVVVTHWRGRGADGHERPVVIKDHPLQRLQPWLATEVALAPTAVKAADFVIDWRGLPDGASIVPARKLPLPVKVARAAGDLPVRLTLLTSQLTPLANNQPDPNKALRLEKAVELGAKVGDAEPVMLVPAELPSPVYDVTVQAELLSADKKTVKAVAFAPVRRMQVKVPVVVKLDGPPRLETTLDPKKGAVVKLAGQVERLEGLKGDVALTLTGLPAGVAVPAVTVKDGTNKFEVTVTLPPTIPAGEIKGLRLSGSAAADPKQPNVRVKSREVELTLVVKAGK